jgi:inner membrane transporter RhtA
VLSSASLQTAAAVATTVFAAFGPAGTAGLRLLSAAALLLAAARPSLAGRDAATWAAITALGATMAGASVLLFLALARLPLGTAVTLQFVGPLALALAGARRAADLLWAGLAAAGVLLLTGGPAGGDVQGVALALGGAACVAASVVASEQVGARTARFEGLALAVAVAALLTLPLALPAAARAPGAEELAAAAGVGLLGVALPYALFLTALRQVGARTYGVLLSLDPAVATVAGLVLLGQTPGAAAVAGTALVVAASAGAVATGRPS